LAINRDISRAWDTIIKNIKISAKESMSLCESKYLKPWIDEECLKLVDQICALAILVLVIWDFKKMKQQSDILQSL
jgi:hypothetical protein